MRTALVLAALLTACATDPAPVIPSCQQAVAHYYGVGCVFSDANGPIAEQTFTLQCQNNAISEPANCVGESDAFLECINAAKGGNNAGCDCSVQYMAVLTCH